MSLRDLLPTFPTCPGVYLMKNATGRIIYVGKAKHLRRRLASYFLPEKRLPTKVRVMMPKVTTIDFLCTATEKEALLLEASLIKQHRPRYNIVLRDDKQYVLFCLTRQDPFPALRLTRKVIRDGSVYFGPFTSAQAARETKRVIDRLFPLRKCRDAVFTNRTRPCLQYHIGRCLGPCCLPVSAEDYDQIVRQVELFLAGKSAELIASLRAEMSAAADRLDFEQAAKLRDSIRALKETTERQAAVLTHGRDVDIIGVHGQDNGVSLAVIFVRQGRIIDGQNFWFGGQSLETAQDEIALVSSFLMQFYRAERFVPGRIVTALGCDDQSLAEILTEMRGSPVSLHKARGDQERRLVDIAQANARAQAIQRCQETRNGHTLAQALGQDTDIERIECVDISHLQGEGTRAGLVVFDHGYPEKSAYRLYTFPDLEGLADDYLALARFTARRLKSGPPWPDLLLIDGGKGQLASVERALNDAGQPNLFALAAIAQSGSKRAGKLDDQVFVPGRKNPLALKPGSPELLFLQQIRDTAHRFVLTKLRQHKRGSQLASDLESLPGVGPKTAKLLWKHFSSTTAMGQATVEDLASLPGFGPKKAQNLHMALRALGPKSTRK